MLKTLPHAKDLKWPIFPLVVLPGVQVGINFFKKILADIKNLTAKGEGTMPGGNEKYRVMWEGIPSRKTDREF